MITKIIHIDETTEGGKALLRYMMTLDFIEIEDSESEGESDDNITAPPKEKPTATAFPDENT